MLKDYFRFNGVAAAVHSLYIYGSCSFAIILTYCIYTSTN